MDTLLKLLLSVIIVLVLASIVFGILYTYIVRPDIFFIGCLVLVFFAATVTVYNHLP